MPSSLFSTTSASNVFISLLSRLTSDGGFFQPAVAAGILISLKIADMPVDSAISLVGL